MFYHTYVCNETAIEVGEPTWVPILLMTSSKENSSMTCTQFPLVGGFVVTVNEAQGLTLKEGVVIHLAGSQRFRPAAKHGLPFVAWKRSESLTMRSLKYLQVMCLVLRLCVV